MVDQDKVQDLLEKVKESNDLSFTLLCELYDKNIRSTAGSFYERHRKAFGSKGVTPDELIQEATIAFHSAAMSYSKDRNVSFYTYASTCMKNRLISALRDLSSDNTISLDALGEIPSTKTPERWVIEQEEYKELLDSICSHLSQMEKRVLKEYLKTKDYQKCADALNIEKKAVDNAMSRIRKKLRETIKSH